MILDVERFRFVNESMGRGAGDNLLKALAERLRERHDSERIGRVGMNSFAVVLPNVTDEIHAARLVEEKRKALLVDPFMIDGSDLRVSARYGVTIFPDDGRDPETLMHNAEAALARAKQAGEPAVYYTPKLNANVAERLALENKLRRALEEQQFVLHYQPKISLESGAIEGFEALHPLERPGQRPGAAGAFHSHTRGNRHDSGRRQMGDGGSGARIPGLAQRENLRPSPLPSMFRRSSCGSATSPISCAACWPTPGLKRGSISRSRKAW